MKKLLFSLLAFFVIAQITTAQEDPGKAVGKAKRALDSYNISPSTNLDKLNEAVKLIDLATGSDVNQNNLKAWQVRGEVYNTIADRDLIAMSLNPEAKPEHPEAPYIAAEAFLKALSLAQKKFETRDALKGMTESAGKLNNIGNLQIQMQKYADAAQSLGMVLQIDKTLRDNGNTPVIPDTEMDNHKYVLAYCAKAGGDTKKAGALFKELYEGGSSEPAVYAEYFSLLYGEGKKDEAWKVFDSATQKFPTSTEILFAGINAKIAEQDYESLKNMLEKAIAAEPNNPSVYSALGNVYMNLFTQEFSTDKTSPKAQQYFDESLSYFSKAIEIDPHQFDAVYSIGSLYFNKGVELLKQANDLPMTKEGQQEYQKLQNEAGELMKTALPYFQKTEAMEPNDMNTLIALSEIYARMNDFEKSKMFKERLENLRNGVKVDSSYFKN